MAAIDGEEQFFEPNVQNLIDQDSLKWIFVGGKGGVGKTTTSCSLGVLMSAVRDSVLIISTDPASNLSDAFAQKFSHEPQLVKGFANLYCMEVEASNMTMDIQALDPQQDPLGLAQNSPFGSLFKDLSTALPGIDETMSFLQIMKSVTDLTFSLIIFDTAPTGHTLRLLRFPTTLTNAFEKINALKSTFGPMFSTMSSLFGNEKLNQENLLNKFEEMKSTIDKVNKHFRDPDFTTFVCVCIPEFLSLYETERLIQELAKYEIDSHNLIVNQVLFAEKDSCRKFLARKKMQDKYLKNMYELYGEDFNITVLPITDDEVRGNEKIKDFAKNFIVPYEVEESQEKVLSRKEVVKFVCEKHKLKFGEVLNEFAAEKIRIE